jgi:myo-inositol-1(or 4)-monophosphatase
MDYLSLAKKAAIAAGAVHKKYFNSEKRIRAKSSSFDLVTIADTKAEEVAVALIRKYYPDHNFLAEENIYKSSFSDYTWVIDPLDGTNNFAYGIPIFCSSVGLIHKDKVIAAAVFDVTRNELFYSEAGKGAFLNRKRIHVNKDSRLKDSLLITGFYYDRGQKMIQTLNQIKEFHFRHVVGIRRLGAAALDLCYVASGRASGFWEFQLSPWDFVAAKLIVEEAGGRLTGRHKEEVPLKEKYFIVASNSLIHNKMLEVINNK